jgi:hypothetical protein
MPAAPPQVVVRAPKPGKACPQLRLGWLSGHQNPGKRARRSASGGYPGTITRQNMPAAPPWVATPKATGLLLRAGHKTSRKLPTDKAGTLPLALARQVKSLRRKSRRVSQGQRPLKQDSYFHHRSLTLARRPIKTRQAFDKPPPNIQ